LLSIQLLLYTRYIHELHDHQRSPGIVLVINVPTLGYLKLTLSYDKYRKYFNELNVFMALCFTATRALPTTK
jgi:hypothetical protein